MVITVFGTGSIHIQVKMVSPVAVKVDEIEEYTYCCRVALNRMVSSIKLLPSKLRTIRSLEGLVKTCSTFTGIPHGLSLMYLTSSRGQL